MVLIQRVLKTILIVPMVASIVSIILPTHIIAVSDQTIVALTNDVREAEGLQSLSWDASLANAAWLKARDMCTKGYWAHTAPDGTTGWTFIEQSRYSYMTAGENLAKDFSDSIGVVEGWMASPTHRENILDNYYSETGVASATCDFKGTTTTIVVALYATPR